MRALATPSRMSMCLGELGSVDRSATGAYIKAVVKSIVDNEGAQPGDVMHAVRGCAAAYLREHLSGGEPAATALLATYTPPPPKTKKKNKGKQAAPRSRADDAAGPSDTAGPAADDPQEKDDVPPWMTQVARDFIEGDGR
jgi:hypothetical protein